MQGSQAEESHGRDSGDALPARRTAALSRSARNGSAVLLLSQLAKMLIQVSGLVVLSRLLSPAAFGILALIIAVIALGEMMRDFGLSSAAIQADSLSPEQASNLFWLNALVGMVLFCGNFAISPAFASLLGEPLLEDALRVAGISFLLLGLQAQFQVSLVRELSFAKIAISDVLAQLAGFVVAVGLALSGAIVPVLIAQVVVPNVVLLLSRWRMARWRPGPPRRGVGTGAFFAFGSRLALSQALNYAATNVDRYAISATGSSHDLGVYSRALQLLTLPITQLLTPLANVAIPVLSKIKHSASEFWGMLRRMNFLISSVAILGFSLTAPLAGSLIPLILGSQWSGAVAPFQILAIGGCFQVLSHSNYWAFVSQGRARELLTYSIVVKPLTVAAVALASSHGLDAVAIAYSCCLAISWPIGLIWLRGSGLPVVKFLGDGVALIAVGGVTAWTVSWIASGSVDSPVLLTSLGGFLVFVVGWLLIPAGRREARWGARFVLSRNR